MKNKTYKQFKVIPCIILSVMLTASQGILTHQASADVFSNTSFFENEIMEYGRASYSYKPFQNIYEQEHHILNQANCFKRPNTIAVYDPKSYEVSCQCEAGYQRVNDSANCLPIDGTQISTDCTNLDEKVPYWSQKDQNIVCDCDEGFYWNKDLGQCSETTTPVITDNQVTTIEGKEEVIEEKKGKKEFVMVKSDYKAYESREEISTFGDSLGHFNKKNGRARGSRSLYGVNCSEFIEELIQIDEQDLSPSQVKLQAHIIRQDAVSQGCRSPMITKQIELIIEKAKKRYGQENRTQDNSI